MPPTRSTACAPATETLDPCAGVTLRPAELRDLAAINAVIADAIGNWSISERVRRNSIPIYQYRAEDFDFLRIRVAVDNQGRIVGVAACEPAAKRDAPAGRRALLLHGIYVDPGCQQQGIGTLLLDRAVDEARKRGFDGLLVRAQVDAIPFFRARGLEALAPTDPARDYPHRFWQTV